MKNQEDSFFINRLKSLRYAWRGIHLLLRSENSIKLQVAIGVLVTIFGVFIKLSVVEWILQTLCIALVISAEAFNTSIEKMADFVHPEHHKKIAEIKDISAGAVSFIAIGALIVGLFIYVPKIIA